MDKDQQIAALTAERDTLKVQVANVTALTAERDKAKADLAALQEAQDKDKHAALLTAALTSGRLAPAQKAWAEKQSLAALTEYLDATAPLVQQERQADKDDDGHHGLNEVELATCTHMGVTPEAYIAARNNKPLTKSA
jgi:phage I-like protein